MDIENTGSMYDVVRGVFPPADVDDFTFTSYIT